MTAVELKIAQVRSGMYDMATRKLADNQVESFDIEYVNDARWAVVRKAIDTQFPSGSFRFIDIGGGNGVFADRVLDTYPNCHGTVLDTSELLLGRNRLLARKSLLLASADALSVITEKFDVVFCNWVLHHLVSDTFSSTRATQDSVLTDIRRLLSPGGRLSIYENNYDGLLVDALPGRLIYELTSSSSFESMARRLGANTAGVGVCFLSRRQWEKAIATAGYQLLEYCEPDEWIWASHWYWKLGLLLKHRRVAHYWIGVRPPELLT